MQSEKEKEKEVQEVPKAKEVSKKAKEVHILVTHATDMISMAIPLRADLHPHSEEATKQVARHIVGYLRSEGVELPAQCSVTADYVCAKQVDSIMELKLNGGFYRTKVCDPTTGEPLLRRDASRPVPSSASASPEMMLLLAKLDQFKEEQQARDRRLKEEHDEQIRQLKEEQQARDCQRQEEQQARDRQLKEEQQARDRLLLGFFNGLSDRLGDLQSFVQQYLDGLSVAPVAVHESLD